MTGRPALRRATVAGVAILFCGALLGLAWSASARSAGKSAGPVPDPSIVKDAARLARAPLSELLALMDHERIGAFEDADVEAIGRQLVRSAIREETPPEEALASIFPSAPKVIAMLARDRDVDDFEESSQYDGAAGDRYRHIVDMVGAMRPLRSSYEALYRGAATELAAWSRAPDPRVTFHYPEYSGGVTLPGASTMPRKREYERSHTYALDIFFTDSEEDPLGSGETGPMLFSLKSGIVVATASDWSGGPGIAAYRSGGISPNAGNGVIVYDPRSRHFFLYFHMRNSLVQPGQLIRAGQPLGPGGDTGANARIPGHGQHLHLEIFDASTARFLRHSQIAAIAFD